ncbi:hypothetical protein BH23DEI1_BH23DEI1_15850 [soil metagenome]
MIGFVRRGRRPGPSLVVLATAAVAIAGSAFAACVVVPGASELRVEQIGRVIFSELATDRARDLVTFGGGVCLELGGVEVRVEAASMIVRAAASAAVSIEAAGATVHAAGWRLIAARLDIDAESVRLADVTLVGHGVVGRATSMVLDLERGVMVASSLEVVTPTVRLVARFGTFVDGDRLVVEGVVASTCECPPTTAPIRVEGGSASLEVTAGILVVEDGILVIEEVRVPMPARLEVSEASLAALVVPITLGIVAEGERGLVVGLADSRDDGAVASGDVAFGARADPRWRAALAAASEGATVRVSARDGALAIAVARRVDLGGGVALVVSQRNEGGVVEGRLQDTALTLQAEHARHSVGDAPWRLDALAAVTGALSAQRGAGGDDVVAARGRVAASLGARAGTLTTGLASLAVEAGATGYVGSAVSQRWIGVAPRWRLSNGALAVDLQHAWRGVAGESPFSERIDRVDAEHRTDASIAIDAPAGLAASVHVRYDWRPDAVRPAAHRVGLERLRVSATVTVRDLGAASLVAVAALTVEAAGALDPRPRRDAFALASLSLATPDRAVEASVATEIGIGPIRSGVRSLTLAGAAPLRFDEGAVTLQPYLALDVWPLWTGTGGPRLVGHGLLLGWVTCCGALDVGYRAHPDGSVTTRVGFAIDAREPSLAELGW